MKYALLPGVVAFLLIGSNMACAGEPDISGIEIVSVAPRGSDVKPFAMTVPAEGRRETAALVRPRADAPSDSGTGKLASVDGRKAAPSASDDKQ